MRRVAAIAPYQPQILVCFLVALGMAMVIGLRLRRAGETRGYFVLLGWIGLACWVAAAMWLLQIPRAPGEKPPLPLQICDMASLAAPLAFLFRERWLRAILYFWGIGLCTQAFATPVLRTGPWDPFFWIFWMYHFVIVGFAILDLVVGGFRPAFRDWVTAVIGIHLYLVVVLPLNLIMGWNFGFIGPDEPGVPTLMDVLGPWPMRVVWLWALTLLVFALIWLPWEVAARMQRRRELAR